MNDSFHTKDKQEMQEKGINPVPKEKSELNHIKVQTFDSDKEIFSLRETNKGFKNNIAEFEPIERKRQIQLKDRELEIENEIESLETEMDRMKRLSVREREDLRQEVESKQQTILQLRDELQAVRVRQDEAQRQMEDMKQEVEHCRQQEDHHRHSAQAAQQQVSSLSTQLESMKQEHCRIQEQQVEEITQLKEENAGLQREMQHLQQAVHDREQQIAVEETKRKERDAEFIRTLENVLKMTFEERMAGLADKEATMKMISSQHDKTMDVLQKAHQGSKDTSIQLVEHVLQMQNTMMSEILNRRPADSGPSTLQDPQEKQS